MPLSRPLRLDRSFALARHGYLFTAALDESERRQLDESGAVTIPFLGRSALLVTGDAGVRLFYDEDCVMRHRAVPAPVATSIFGPGAIHGLDDDSHRHRKTMFLEALRQEELDRLVAIARERWRRELEGWRREGAGEVYASAVVALGSSIIEWAGINEPEPDMAGHARWMADIVGGFGVLGPAYVKAGLARRRCDDWAAHLIRRARTGGTAQPGSWLDRVATFLDEDGSPLSERTAAVELLNILRPTVAVSWLAAFAALALEQNPQWRARLREAEGADRAVLAEAFGHEVRRYYPFVPILAGRARQDIEFAGQSIKRGHRILLDVYGTNHGGDWEDPWSFDPGRFLDVDPCDVTSFVPQGGGPRRTGHRCPGEGVANALLALAVSELAQLEPVELPVQDLQHSMRRMPTRPPSGVRVAP